MRQYSAKRNQLSPARLVIRGEEVDKHPGATVRRPKPREVDEIDPAAAGNELWTKLGRSGYWQQQRLAKTCQIDRPLKKDG